MFKKLATLVIVSLFIFSLSGCATARKQKDLEIQGLKNQVQALETQMQSKDEEINNLKDSLTKAQSEREIAVQNINKKGITSRVKSRPNNKQIQMALKNAGYNPGTIDGKMGKDTRDAIKSFQKASNLKADGKVGKATWNLLIKYLYEKVK